MLQQTSTVSVTVDIIHLDILFSWKYCLVTYLRKYSLSEQDVIRLASSFHFWIGNTLKTKVLSSYIFKQVSSFSTRCNQVGKKLSFLNRQYIENKYKWMRSSDFVTNSYGESWDSFCENSWVPVKNQRVPVKKHESVIENAWAFM